MMLKAVSLKIKLMILGFAFCAIPLLLVASISFYQNLRTSKMVIEETANSAGRDLEHIVKGVYATCEAVQEQVQNEVNKALNVARDILHRSGSVSLSTEKVSWQAANQYTEKKEALSLPKFMVGGTWIGKTDQMAEPSLMVDTAKSLVGGTCTLFQRIDEAGSMLRVATNVIKKDGTRATGTFIPATNPDGNPNPVVASVLAGKTFKGRAFVVDRWYITAYEPIFNAAKRVVGMLYVGIPQESVTTLRTAILETKVGETGYLSVIDSGGAYVISKNGAHDGQQILDYQSEDGSEPIKALIGEAVQFTAKQVGAMRYGWKDPGAEVERDKVVRFMYFKPWDWIIVAGVDGVEFESLVAKFDAVNHSNAVFQLLVIAIVLGLATPALYVVARGITAPLVKGVDFARAMAKGDFTQTIEVRQKDEIGVLAEALNGMVTNLRQMLRNVADSTLMVTASSGELSSISELLASGARQSTDKADTVARATGEMTDNFNSVASASEQAAINMQMVATAAEEMNATIKGIASNTEQGRMITEKAVLDAQGVTEKVTELGRATKDVGNITETITEISEQTNLLALNATIEAARAGEAGKGFAVVANEIKDLAKQTADATQEINLKISGIQTTTAGTVKEIEQIVAVIREISEIVATVAVNIEEQAAATEEIASNVTQASRGIQEVNANVANGSQAAGGIADDIGAVSAASQEVSQNSAKVFESAQNLTALAAKLNDQLTQFNV